MDLRRIEFPRGGRSLAHDLIIRGLIDGHQGFASITFAGAPSGTSARASHHNPKPSIIAAAMMPRPGAANGVVPKNGIGMAFWIDGVPGRADMVKVEVPSTIAAGISRRGTAAARNNACAMGLSTKKATKRLTPP